MNLKHTLIALTLGVAAASAVSATASAQPLEQPRKAEVMARAVHERREIKAEMRRGEIGPAKAHRLLVGDHRVMRETRHHHRLSLAEQHRLNRQESRIHRHLQG